MHQLEAKCVSTPPQRVLVLIAAHLLAAMTRIVLLCISSDHLCAGAALQRDKPQLPNPDNQLHAALCLLFFEAHASSILYLILYLMIANPQYQVAGCQAMPTARRSQPRYRERALEPRWDVDARVPLQADAWVADVAVVVTVEAAAGVVAVVAAADVAEAAKGSASLRTWTKEKHRSKGLTESVLRSICTQRQKSAFVSSATPLWC